MKAVVLFSGGKDSCLSTWYAVHQGWEISGLLTAQPRSADSWMFHYPATEWVRLQALAMKMPLHIFQPSGDKQSELEELTKALGEMKRTHHVEAVVSGAVASNYQRGRIDEICQELNLSSFSPLWGKDPKLLLRELIDRRFEIYVTGVAALGLDGSWLGRRLDESSVKELLALSQRYRFNPAGEGGEYETFVADCPLFRERIRFDRVRREMGGSGGHLVIEEASLIQKE